ncbi:MAG: DNA primase [Patescibacteria group bacterium]
MSDVTDQIKERLNVADFVGEYLKLEKAGTNYKALCPFHNEKTPSFMVNPERNFWYCFGCQKGGDIFTFVMEMEGLEFPEALKRLAERAGVEVPRFQKANIQEKNKKEVLYEIMEVANRFFEAQFGKSSSGEKARKYLLERSIPQKQIENFRIGLAPEGWSYLLDFLLNQGYDIVDIAKTGLLVQKENTSGGSKGDYYDRFRGRITFPILDPMGKVVGHSARVMPGGDEKTAKYINTPQTHIYDKSNVLYGLNLAKTEIKRQGFVVVVEGNMDVIASFGAGLENIVAVSGTALTSQQVNILKRYTQNIKLCFDMDEAGQNAVAKSAQTCLENEMETEVIILPKGFKDVNELTIKDKNLWAEAVENSYPVMEYFFSAIMNKHDCNSPQGKRLIAHELLNIIKYIADPIEQSYWLRKLSDSIRVEEDTLTQVLEKVKVKNIATQNTDRNENGSSGEGLKSQERSKSKLQRLQERLLGVFSLYRDQLIKKSQEFDESLLEERYLALWEKLKSGKEKDASGVIDQYETRVKYEYDSGKGFLEMEIDPLVEWDNIIKELAREKKKKQLKEIVWDIKRAEEEGDEEGLNFLLENFNKLSKEIQE